MHHPSADSLTLENGLRVVAIPQPQLHRAHLALYVRVGSRYETASSNGISHFLEHMLYRGTTRLPSAHEVNLAFEELGGYLYAATHTDFGVFSVTLPPESLAAATALFSEVLTSPGFYDIDLERGIVSEEILEDLDDEGRQVDPDNLSRALIYPSHPLGFTITGSQEHIASFTPASLADHHRSHYSAENSVLVFSGAVGDAKPLELAKHHFASFLRGPRMASPVPVHAQKKPRLQVIENVSSQTELRICLRAIAENDTRYRKPLEVLMRIIDDGMSTRLYHRICDSQGLCYDVSAGFDGYEDDGVIDVAAGVQHARASQVTSEVLALLVELSEKGPTDAEVTKAKKRYAWDMTALFDSAEDLGGYYGAGMLFERFEATAEKVRAIQEVSAREVQDVARMLVRPERLNVVAVGLLEPDEHKRLTDIVKGWKPPKA